MSLIAEDKLIAVMLTAPWPPLSPSHGLQKTRFATLSPSAAVYNKLVGCSAFCLSQFLIKLEPAAHIFKMCLHLSNMPCSVCCILLLLSWSHPAIVLAEGLPACGAAADRHHSSQRCMPVHQDSTGMPSPLSSCSGYVIYVAVVQSNL